MVEYSLAQKMLLIMASVMVLLGLVDYAFLAETGGEEHYFNFNETMGAQLTGDGTLSSDLSASYDNVSIEAADSIDEDTGNVFTDLFKSVRSWVNKQEGNIGFATSILKQPGGFFKHIGMPQFLVTAFGMIWYLLASLAVLSLITGRN